MTIITTPGHTPGSISVKVKENGQIALLCGDSPKSAWEFIRGFPLHCYGSLEDFKDSIKKIRRVADLIIPGHDRPFLIKKGKVEYKKPLRIEIYVNLIPEEEELVYVITDQNRIRH